LVDQVWAEGTDPTGGGLYYERNSNQHRWLQVFETGSEDFMTGGWVRVLATAEQVRKERPGMERAAKAGLVTIHGTHRGVLLVEFLDVPWG
jgi:transglutaminase-like putative cysteine protease